MAYGSLLIHIVRPSRTQSEPSRRARVDLDPGSEPKPGSVGPKQPIAPPAAIRGTEARERSPESVASISRQATPYSVADMPAQQ
jgi:hypothetical protein